MSLNGDGAISIHNNAARRLFGSTHVTRVSDLSQFGDDFRKKLITLAPGERHLVTFKIDDIEFVNDGSEVSLEEYNKMYVYKFALGELKSLFMFILDEKLCNILDGKSQSSSFVRA